MENTTVHTMHHWHHPSVWIADDAGEPKVGLGPQNWRIITLTKTFNVDRWLLDVDRDEEGMQVLVDLHGGDPNDVTANEEFQDIKDRIIFEVRIFSHDFSKYSHFVA